MVFIFHSYHTSEPVSYGDLTVKVDFLRLNRTRNKYIKFSTFEETIKVGYRDLEWIEKKRSKDEKSKAKNKKTTKGEKRKSS